MKMILRSVLLVIIVFSIFTNYASNTVDISFNMTTEKISQTADTITNSEIIIETVQTTIKRSQIESLFPPSDFALIVKEQLPLITFVNHITFPNQFIGFISVVQYQSNYLP